MTASHVGDEVALVYLAVAITTGALVAHVLSRIAPWLPYTPTLLIIGVLTSLLKQWEDFVSTHIQSSI